MSKRVSRASRKLWEAYLPLVLNNAIVRVSTLGSACAGIIIKAMLGRVPRLAHRRVILFFWPIRASSWNQISILSLSTFFAHAIASRRAGKFF